MTAMTNRNLEAEVTMLKALSGAILIELGNLDIDAYRRVVASFEEIVSLDDHGDGNVTSLHSLPPEFTVVLKDFLDRLPRIEDS